MIQTVTFSMMLEVITARRDRDQMGEPFVRVRAVLARDGYLVEPLVAMPEGPRDRFGRQAGISPRVVLLELVERPGGRDPESEVDEVEPLLRPMRGTSELTRPRW